MGRAETRSISWRPVHAPKPLPSRRSRGGAAMPRPERCRGSHGGFLSSVESSSLLLLQGAADVGLSIGVPLVANDSWHDSSVGPRHGSVKRQRNPKGVPAPAPRFLEPVPPTWNRLWHFLRVSRCPPNANRLYNRSRFRSATPTSSA